MNPVDSDPGTNLPQASLRGWSPMLCRRHTQLPTKDSSILSAFLCHQEQLKPMAQPLKWPCPAKLPLTTCWLGPSGSHPENFLASGSTNGGCMNEHHSVNWSHKSKPPTLFFCSSQSFCFLLNLCRKRCMPKLKSETYSKRQLSDCAWGLAQILSAAHTQCNLNRSWHITIISINRGRFNNVNHIVLTKAEK